MKPRSGLSFFFWLFFLAGLAFAALSYFGELKDILSFFWNRSFLLLVKIVSGVAFFLLFLRWLGRKLPQKVLKWIYGVIFLPVLVLPVFSCYFKIPYVFCRVCPNRCPWGLLRTFVFSSFILLNLSGKFWCSALCPFGTLQESQAGFSKRSFKLPAWAVALSYSVLFTIAGMYLLTLVGSRWTGFFDLGRYGWVGGTALATLGIFIVSFFIPKFWCRFLCPVGAIAELASGLKEKK